MTSNCLEPAAFPLIQCYIFNEKNRKYCDFFFEIHRTYRIFNKTRTSRFDLSFCCIENNLLLHEMQSISRLISEVILIRHLQNTNTFSNSFSELWPCCLNPSFPSMINYYFDNISFWERESSNQFFFFWLKKKKKRQNVIYLQNNSLQKNRYDSID